MSYIYIILYFNLIQYLFYIGYKGEGKVREGLGENEEGNLPADGDIIRGDEQGSGRPLAQEGGYVCSRE